MSLRSWFRLWKFWSLTPERSHSRGRSGRQPRNRARLGMDILEARALPAQVVFASTDVPKTIADLATITSTITIANSFLVADVNVRLDINHTYDRDLDVFLLGPDGTTVELFTDVGGGGDNFRHTFVDDEASTAITSGSAPFRGAFRPEGSLTLFDGKNAQGTWTLRITDDQGGDVGTLNSWALELPPPQVTYTSTDVPKSILDVQTVTSSLTVPDSLRIADVNVRLDVSHTAAADLEVFLIAPNGTSVELFSDVGGFANNFQNTFLDDEAGTSIVSGAAPFSSAFRPKGLLGSFDGLDTQGVWTLRITDDEAGDVGTLNSWSLEFQRQPDLVGTSFEIIEDGALWGDEVTIHYTIANPGNVDAGPFAVALMLSDDATVDAGDTVVTSFAVTGLLAGTSTSGTLIATLPGLPGSPPGSFTEPDDVVLGFRLDANNTVAELDETNNASRGAGLDLGPLRIGQIEDESNGTLATANAIELSRPNRGFIANANDLDFYSVTLIEPGRLTVEVQGTGALDAVLTLFGPDEELLLTSDDRAPGDVDPLLQQHLLPEHLLPGTYFLRVSAAAGSTTPGDYRLTTRFAAATAPLEPMRAGQVPAGLVTGDFNGDGHTDLAVANAGDNNLSVLLGNGDGSFAAQTTIYVGNTPYALVVGDFDGDGDTDLAVANGGDNNLSVLLGNGDGSFAAQTTIDVGDNPYALVTGDFNGDSDTDLATVNRGGDDVTVLLGHGDGTFTAQPELAIGAAPSALVAGNFNGDDHTDLAVVNSDDEVVLLLSDGSGGFAVQPGIAVGTGPSAVVAADFNGDGLTDLATANANSYDVTVLLGDGFGGFAARPAITVGAFPFALAVGDFNGDGRTDLAAANRFGDDVTVLLGDGAGGFAAQSAATVGASPVALVAADFNGDGRTDLATANRYSDDATVLLGSGDGSFAAPPVFAVGADPVVLVADDFDGDGHLDLATANGYSDDVSVLLGKGDGRFARQPAVAVGDVPFDLVVGDFNGDGRPDLAAANEFSDDVSVLLGNGDGSFAALPPLAFGYELIALLAEDFNGDGRTDLATANSTVTYGSFTVTVLLGNGDGSFAVQDDFPVGAAPLSLLAGDFDRDGDIDLATANFDSDNVTILLGDGAGNFATQLNLAAGNGPTAMVAGDFDGDGHTDLAAANRIGNSVRVLRGNGTGGFVAQPIVPVGVAPVALLAKDFNGDGRTDLATANQGSDTVTVLLASGGGFAVQPAVAVGNGPSTLLAADLDGDGDIDLATANRYSDNVTVLLGNGTGLFAALPDNPDNLVGDLPVALLAEDFNGDGRPDLAAANLYSDDVSVLLGKGAGAFEDSRLEPFGAPDNSPILALVNDDALPDALSLDGAGNILLRRAIVPGAFTAPTIINPDDPALDAALVQTAAGRLVIAVNKEFGDDLSVFTVDASGTSTPLDLSPFPNLHRPVRIASADFDGNGLDDLAVVNAGSHTASFFHGVGNGQFQFVGELAIGAGPSVIELTDFDGINGIDVLISSGTSGDASILLNDGTGNFTAAGHFRAGFGLEGLGQAFDGTVFVHSLAETNGLAVGDFDEDGTLDIVAMNSNYRSFTFLAGTGKGTVVNAAMDSSRTLSGATSTLIRAGQFDAANSPFDVAVLNPDEQTITVFLGQGDGSFIKGFTTKAGLEPSGFSVAQVNDDNGDTIIDEQDQADLLVGNELGDLLFLFGAVDGTFAPPRPDGQSIPLAVADLDGNGVDDFVFASEADDQISVAFNQSELATTVQDAQDGLLAPDAVRLIDLDGDQVNDLVVSNSGANQVYVYLGQMVGNILQFRTDAGGFRRFDVGTNPVSMTFAQLNSDALLDIIVTNQGSNSLTFLQGTGSGAGWTMTNHVRSNTGLNSGPTSTLLRDVRRADGSVGQDGIDDILVSNSQSNTVGVIRGNGGGNFDLNPSAPINVGINPTLLVPVTGGFVSVNRGGSLTRINDALQVVDTVATRGSNPSTALAGDFNGDGNVDLIVGSSGDGILELFLDDGGELLAAGFLDTDLNISAMALSVIQGSRVFYVTSDGVEQAFAFSLDDFASEERGTVADLPDSSVAIIAALVTGSAELNTEFFSGGDGETVNFGELLFFSDGSGGIDPAAVLEELRGLVEQFVQTWSDTFGPGEGGGWQVIVSAVQSVLDTASALEVAGFNPFAGWRTVVAHLQLPGIGESLVSSLVKAGQETLSAGPVATTPLDDAALRSFVFGRSLKAPFDYFESLAVADEATVERQDNEPILPEAAMSRWWALPVERQTEELLLAGLLAASMWKPEPARARKPSVDFTRPG
jgi:subtilisin-like proprotein convertase family protein